jgi:hypothetical protein
MPEFLAPLELLRSIEHFQIRDAMIFEIPDEIDQDENTIQYESLMHDLVPPIRQYEPFINGSLPLMNVPPIGQWEVY